MKTNKNPSTLNSSEHTMLLETEFRTRIDSFLYMPRHIKHVPKFSYIRFLWILN